MDLERRSAGRARAWLKTRGLSFRERVAWRRGNWMRPIDNQLVQNTGSPKANLQLYISSFPSGQRL